MSLYGIPSEDVVVYLILPYCCSERRQALEASLPEEQRLLVDMARVGLIFNCYNGLQVGALHCSALL